MKRSGIAVWHGSGKEGKGSLSTLSNTLNNIPYTYSMRYENSPGTNPEELIATAHAACFTMKLSFNLSNAGFIPDSIETRCEVFFDTKANEITKSTLYVVATVKGITEENFTELVNDAKINCPVSKVLKAEVSVESRLEINPYAEDDSTLKDDKIKLK
jgi:lipoyl-dependent peroxiredoxin